VTTLRLGLVVAEPSALERVRPDDDVALVVLRNTLLDMPRASSARRIGERVHARLPRVQLVPYAWHFVTHAPDDRLPGRGERSVDGELARTGHLSDSPEVLEAWAATVRAAQGMGATHVVLRTPIGFAPGVRGRKRLENFVGTHASEGLSLVWEPEGLWSPEGAGALSARLGVTLMAPPPADGALEVSGRWIVIGTGGSPAELRGGAAEELVDDLADSDAETATVLFAGSAGLKNLRRVQRLWREFA
jgi:hypothetical protein